MEATVLLRGIVIGLSIAAPVGPIGLLCFQRAMNKGMLHGLLSGLGAATADALYGLVAAFGLTAVIMMLTGNALWLKTAGGLFLCYLGWTTFRAQPAARAAHAASSSGLLKDYATTFALTVVNPMTVLSFLAIFAGLGADSASQSVFLVAGVFLGSAMWWLVLCTIAVKLKTRFTQVHMRWLNRLSGAIIAGFGVWMLAGVVSAGAG